MSLVILPQSYLDIGSFYLLQLLTGLVQLLIGLESLNRDSNSPKEYVEVEYMDETCFLDIGIDSFKAKPLVLLKK